MTEVFNKTLADKPSSGDDNVWRDRSVRGKTTRPYFRNAFLGSSLLNELKEPSILPCFFGGFFGDKISESNQINILKI